MLFYDLLSRCRCKIMLHYVTFAISKMLILELFDLQQQQKIQPSVHPSITVNRFRLIN